MVTFDLFHNNKELAQAISEKLEILPLTETPLPIWFMQGPPPTIHSANDHDKIQVFKIPETNSFKFQVIFYTEYSERKELEITTKALRKKLTRETFNDSEVIENEETKKILEDTKLEVISNGGRLYKSSSYEKVIDVFDDLIRRYTQGFELLLMTFSTETEIDDQRLNKISKNEHPILIHILDTDLFQLYAKSKTNSWGRTLFTPSASALRELSFPNIGAEPTRTSKQKVPIELLDKIILDSLHFTKNKQIKENGAFAGVINYARVKANDPEAFMVISVSSIIERKSTPPSDENPTPAQEEQQAPPLPNGNPELEQEEEDAPLPEMEDTALSYYRERATSKNPLYQDFYQRAAANLGDEAFRKDFPETNHLSPEERQKYWGTTGTTVPYEAVDGTNLKKEDYKENLLRKGNFGKVYAVKIKNNEENESFIAIKKINDSSDNEALKKEIKALKKAFSPAIVAFYGAIELDVKKTCIAMQLAICSLDTIIMKQLPVSYILQILHQIALGLAVLHYHKVIHCDIKPANILIDSHLQVRLADFDIAKVMQTVGSSTGSLIQDSISGTQNYRSPESFDNVILSASDIYSFGLVAWSLVIRKILYSKKLDAAIMKIRESQNEVDSLLKCNIRKAGTALDQRAFKKETEILVTKNNSLFNISFRKKQDDEIKTVSISDMDEDLYAILSILDFNVEKSSIIPRSDQETYKAINALVSSQGGALETQQPVGNTLPLFRTILKKSCKHKPSERWRSEDALATLRRKVATHPVIEEDIAKVIEIVKGAVKPEHQKFYPKIF